MEYLAEIKKNGHVWQENRSNRDPELGRRESVGRNARKYEASYRGNKTRSDAYLKETIRKEGPVGHPERISTLPRHEIKEIRVYLRGRVELEARCPRT